MHGNATFNMPVPGPHNCCRHEMCSAWPKNEHSPWKLHSRNTNEKTKQNSARNNAKCSKCFLFLCNNSDRIWFSNALTFVSSLGTCWKPWPSASVFNTFPRDLANINAWKPMFHPYIVFDGSCLALWSPRWGRGISLLRFFFFFFFFSSLVAFLIAKDAKFSRVDNKESDSSARIHRLIWVFVGRTY